MIWDRSCLLFPFRFCFRSLPSFLRFAVVSLTALPLIGFALPAPSPGRPGTAVPMILGLGNGPGSGPASTPATVVHGTVADPSGAIVPNAEVELVDGKGAVAATLHSDGEGNFQLPAPALGGYTLVVSEAGFDTVKTVVKLGPQSAAPLTPMLHIVLPISAASTTINVNAGSSVDLTATDANSDTSVMSADDLKALPIFDNDY